jgi:hypothetical protein
MLLYIITLVSVCRVLYIFLRFLYLHCFFEANVQKYRRGSNGSAAFAVVTGSTNGIGAGFAEEIASRGFNL